MPLVRLTRNIPADAQKCLHASLISFLNWRLPFPAAGLALLRISDRSLLLAIRKYGIIILASRHSEKW